MTLRAIVGLVVLNLFVLGVGYGALRGLAGRLSGQHVLRLGGLAYLLGVAVVEVIVSLELVLGVPFTRVTVVVTGLVVVIAGVLVGRRRVPPSDGSRLGLPPISVVSALLASAVVAYLVSLFRSLRLAELYDWDAWFNWTLKAKALYYFDGLEEWVFGAIPSTGHAYTGYPIGFPIFQALAFDAMGSADVVTVNLLYWFFSAGFAAAVVGLVAGRVRMELVLAVLLAALVMPGFTGIPVPGGAERPLAFLVAIAALLVLLWLEERRAWQLGCVSILLAGAMVTKREGALLAVCVVAAAFVAAIPQRRFAWPRIALAGLVAVGLAVPWRLWVLIQGLPSDAPDAGYWGTFEHLDRVLPALGIALRALLGYELWLMLPAATVLACIVGLLGPRSRSAAVFLGVFLSLAVLGSAWVTVANPGLGLSLDYAVNPATRFMVTPALTAAAILPLLLTRMWQDSEHGTAAVTARLASARALRAGLAQWAIVAATVLVYPASIATGYDGLRLPGGPPPFPSPEECTSMTDGRLVIGYAGTYREARQLQRESSLGERAVIEHDGCGRLRISLATTPRRAAPSRG